MNERTSTERATRRTNVRTLVGVTVALLVLVVSGLTHPSLSSVALSEHGTAVHRTVSGPSGPSAVLTSALGGANVTPTWLKVCASGGAQFLPICPMSAGVGPKKVHGEGLAWEPKNGATGGFALEFGGSTAYTSGVQNSTFKWTPQGAARWVAVANGPSTLSPRTNVSFVWDSADSEFLEFGGWVSTASVKNDTWKWTDVGGWAQVTGQTGLAKLTARYSACMVNVPTYAGSKGGFVLLFGGRGAGNTRTQDTWTFHAGTWTNITASVGSPPSARGDMSCAWDDADKEVVLFGGYDTALLNDTWTFVPSSTSGGTWFHPSTPVAPNPRQFAAMGYVNGSSELVLFSGAAGGPAFPTNRTADTWVFKAGTWTNLTSKETTFGNQGANLPPFSWGGAVADLSGYGQGTGAQFYAMLFGGQGTNAYNSSTYFGAIPSATLQENVGEVVASKTAASLYFNTTGGFGFYKYAWTGLPTGCATANTSTLTCQPTVTGVLSGINVSVTDASNVSVASSYTVGLTSDPSLFYNFTTVKQTTSVANETAQANVTFWAARLAVNKPANSTLAALINTTPVRYWRYGILPDTVNATNFTLGGRGVTYSDAGVPSQSQNNLSQFITLMKWTHSHYWIDLPTETNDSGQAVQEVAYVENTLHARPDYWAFGIEPQSWIHYNIKPYWTWKTTDSSTPTAAQYAATVARFINAIRAFDPLSKFIGTENLGTAGLAGWASNVYTSSGTFLSGVAFHFYPDGSAAQPYLTYSKLMNAKNLALVPATVSQYRANATAACGSCAISVRLDEWNTGTVSPWAPYMAGYPNVVFTSSEIAQTLLANTTDFTYFDFYGPSSISMVNLTTQATNPVYKLYSGVFSHLALGRIFNVTVGNATGAGSSMRSGIWSVESVPINPQANGPQLLVVNGNTTVSFRANVSWFKSLVLANQSATVYVDNFTSGVVSTVYGPGVAMPSVLTLAPMSVLVVNVSGQPGPAVGLSIPQSTLLLWLTLAGLTLSVVTLAIVLATRKGR